MQLASAQNKLKCSACDVEKLCDSFLIFEKKTLMCDDCQQLGYTPRDVALYTCSDCLKKWGTQLPRSELSRTTLKHASARSFHCCTKCEQRRNHLQQNVCGTRIKCDCGEVHQATRKACPISHHSQEINGYD